LAGAGSDATDAIDDDDLDAPGVVAEDGGIWSGRLLPVTVANLTVVAIAAFDGLAIVAALGDIGADLGDIAFLPWVITAYLATSAVAVIVAGPVIDAIGVRRTFRVTGLWFLVWSAAAAVAPTMPALIAARVLQGLGGGLVMAVAIASVGLAYPHRLRPRAFAANSMVWGVMGFGGPAVAGALLTIGDWRLIFVVQLPITALALAMGWRTLPSTRDRPARITMDWWGTMLLTLLTVSSLVGVSAVGGRWWLVATGIGTAVAAGVWYWRHSGRATDPVLHREHLVRFPLGGVHITSGLVLIAGLAADNYLPVYVQTTRGRSEGLAAFSLVFLTVGWTAGSIVYSRGLSRRREVDVIVLGAGLIVPSTVLAATAIALGWPLWTVFTAFTFIGLSIGLVSTAGLTLLQASSEPTEMGRTNSAHQFVRTLCITYGVALGGAILLLVVSRQVGDVDAVRDVLAGEDVALGEATNRAIGDGLAWTAGFSCAVALVCFAAADRLRRRFGRPSRPIH
jgi:MFS family permease